MTIKEFFLKIYKNITKWLIATGIIVVAFGAGEQIKDNNIPDELKLKSDISKIINVKEIGVIKIDGEHQLHEFSTFGYTDDKIIVKYVYVSNTETEQDYVEKADRIYLEDVSKRKNYARFYPDAKKMKIYSGTQFWKDTDGVWKDVMVATTTKKVMEDEIKESKLFSWLFGKKALAEQDNFYDEDGFGALFAWNDSDCTQSNWDTLHDSTDGGANVQKYLKGDETGVPAATYCNFSSNNVVISRAFLPFKTVDILSNYGVISASLHLSFCNEFVDDETAYDYIAVVQTSQSSTSTLVNGDFDQCGSINNPTIGSAKISSSSITATCGADDYTTIPLNITGINWIKDASMNSNCGNTSVKGWTCLGLRYGQDIQDIWDTGHRGYYDFLLSDYGGDGPYLEIEYGNKYDLASTTGAWAWYGEDTPTSTPPATSTALWWLQYNHNFTTGMINNASTSNSAWASTTPTSSTAFTYNFGQLIHQFELAITETASEIQTTTIRWIGYGSTNKEPSSLNDLRMWLYNWTTKSWKLATSSLDAGCSSGNCILEYATSNDYIADYISSSSTIKYLVQKYEAKTNCSSSPSTIVCGKYATSTDLLSNEVNTGCQPQTSSQDLWNQCTAAPNIALGCYTGNCKGSPDYLCGWHTTGQRSCPTCYGCRAAAAACEAKTAQWGETENYGCSGTCSSCSSGSCNYTNCVGIQCGCSDGYICNSSGSCVAETPPSCATICAGLGYTSGGCYQTWYCNALGRYVDGNSTDCPLPFKCCCY